MADKGWVGSAVKRDDIALEIGVGARCKAVLARMLGPGFEHEPFEHYAGIGGNLRDAPSISGAASPLATDG